jgi:dTDP-4-amino-4,6-dideoxygalactose transaminase
MKNITKVIKIPTFLDSRGNLSAINIRKKCGFLVKRIYYLYNLKKNKPRGSHAHKNLKQLLICVKGKVIVYFNKREKSETKYILNSPNKGLLIQDCIWCDIQEFEKDSILLVLASEDYNKKDYLRNRDQYRKYISQKKIIKNISYAPLDRMHKSLESRILPALESVIRKGKYILGNEVSKFEKNYAKFSKTKYVVGCGNGFDALVLALKSIDICCDDEVIVPANSFVATAMAVSSLGAKPIFADCDYNNFSIDLESVKNKITKKTKAIIPVSLYGIPLDASKISSFAKKYNLKIIEDASQSHGACFFSNNYQKVKKFSNWKISTFSFYPTKNLGAIGDAGAVATNDSKLYFKIKSLRNYGFEKFNSYKYIGINSRLDEIQAAILNIKLDYINDWTVKKRKIAKIYFRELKKVTSIKLIDHNLLEKSVLHVFPVKVLNNKRDSLIAFLNKNNIETNIHYPQSINKQPIYKKFKTKLKNCNILKKELLSLPIDPFHTNDEILYVCFKIKEFFSKI